MATRFGVRGGAGIGLGTVLADRPGCLFARWISLSFV